MRLCISNLMRFWRVISSWCFVFSCSLIDKLPKYFIDRSLKYENTGKPRKASNFLMLCIPKARERDQNRDLCKCWCKVCLLLPGGALYARGQGSACMQRMYGNKQRQQTDYISAICVFLWMLKLKRDLQDGIWARAQSEIGLSPDFPFARLHISKVHMIFKEYHFARQHISKVIIIFKDYYILYF